MSPSCGPFPVSHPGVSSRVIQGSFPGGRPKVIQASPLPAVPARPPAPVPVRSLSAPAPILPGRPATGAFQAAQRPGEPGRPILRAKVRARHSSGCIIAPPASATADPPE